MIDRRSVLAGMAALPLAACATPAAPRIVASFSILGDIVRTVGGARITVETLVGVDSDAHTYTPSAADVRTIARADLVLINGLGFEGWMERLVRTAGGKRQPIVATSGVTPFSVGGAADPHAWQDARNGNLYVRAVVAALVDHDPRHGADYRTRGAAYEARLLALDRSIRLAMGRVAVERRNILTAHDAFGYFGRAYGVRFFAPEGLSTEAEPSARDIARIIGEIRAKRIAALFIENITDPRIVEQISRETGVRVGGRLFSDALSALGGPADSYPKLLAHNASTIINALGDRVRDRSGPT